MTWAPCPHGVRTRGKKKVGDVEGDGHSKRRKPAGESAKGIPPRMEVISPWCQNGVFSNSVKCCVIAKSGLLLGARVKQVKHWTYPNMVSAPLCTNWKCRTSTEGTKVPPGHPPLPLSTTRLLGTRS